MNFVQSGVTLTEPEAFRSALEIILDSNLTKHEAIIRLTALDSDCAVRLRHSKAARRLWDADYWRGNRRRVQKAITLVSKWPDSTPVRIPISTIYHKPTLRPVNRLAAETVVPR